MCRLYYKLTLNIMKKALIIFSALTSIIGVSAFISMINGIETVSAARSTLTFSYLDKNVATTSLTVMGINTATSSIVVPTSMADQVDLNIQETASTTSTVLNWIVQYSDDSNCDTASSSGATFSYINGCNWFTESISSSSESASLTQESASAIHQWTPGTIATSTKHVSIQNVGANYVKVSFYSTVATSSIWAVASVKSQVQ